MSTKLTTQIIQDAIGNVDTYITTVNDLYSQLNQIVTTLTSQGGGFEGDAATGFKDFFDTTINPMLTKNLTEEGSVTTGLKKLLNDINESLMKTIDPKLGDTNRNAGSASNTND